MNCSGAARFHTKLLGTFATGGCDGLVNVWDGKNRKRISQFRKYPTSISALSFNHDGSQLGIDNSYEILFNVCVQTNLVSYCFFLHSFCKRDSA